MKITNLEMMQATIEIFCGLVCLMLAIIIKMNGYERKSWKQMNRMCLLITGIFFSEACAYIFRGNTDKLSLFMTQSSNFFVFFLNIILIHLFMNYMYYLLQEKNVTPGKGYKTIVNVCVVVDIFILFSNLICKWMYYFDERNYYHRNIGWYIYTGIVVICILTSSVMSICYRRKIRKIMLAALLLYAFAPVIAIILQTFIYGISLTYIGVFLAMVLMLFAYLREWGRAKENKAYENENKKTLELIILLVIMTISMSAAMISCIISINRISNQNAESNSMLLAHMINDNIEKEFIKPIMVAETMSNDYSLKEYMKRSGEDSPEKVEEQVAAYLDSIRTGFGYQMVFAVCDASKTYYDYNGIGKMIDMERDSRDIWYKQFLEKGKHYELDVDTDEASQWELSVFVNTEIRDENGNFLGVCGVGIEMSELQKLFLQFEDEYDAKVMLIDETGLIQVASDAKQIERDYVDISYLDKVTSDEFYYEGGKENSLMTKYLDDLGWYLIVEDCNPEKINVLELTTSSIIIFMIGLMMMGVAFSIITIRERKVLRELEEKRRMSITDDVTGLLNRRAYEEVCTKIEETDSAAGITIIMMDVNGLKTANDTYGHMAGDELLIAAAKCILTSMGKYGKVYRTGGDEFVALLECTEEQLQDMLQTFEHNTRNWKGTYQYELSLSKGIVIGAEHGDMTFAEMKALSDQLMYEDKKEYYKRTGKRRR